MCRSGQTDRQTDTILTVASKHVASLQELATDCLSCNIQLIMWDIPIVRSY